MLFFCSTNYIVLMRSTNFLVCRKFFFECAVQIFAVRHLDRALVKVANFITFEESRLFKGEIGFSLKLNFEIKIILCIS